MVEYPQVIAHYAPSTGYFPLAWWAGLAVLCGYTLVLAAAASQPGLIRSKISSTAAAGSAASRARG